MLRSGEDNKANFISACTDFKKHFAETPLTLAFEASEDFSRDAHTSRLQPDAQSAHYFKLFKALLGDTCLRVGKASKPEAPVTLEAGADKSNYAMLGAKQPALIPVTVSSGPEGSCEVSALYSAWVPVGQKGVSYEIPIPKAAMFGKQVFVANFDDAGALTVLQYAKEAGEGAAINVAQAAVNAVKPETDAERAKRLGDEADLIVAQQRLVKCRADPEKCS